MPPPLPRCGSGFVNLNSDGRRSGRRSGDKEIALKVYTNRATVPPALNHNHLLRFAVLSSEKGYSSDTSAEKEEGRRFRD